ncbi:MAG: ABC transporter ATP-binding protein [Candidatus Methanoplasma sp.]|jgi:iron complex transport system ATP-binding protein|nr:ABC transporter ATP-binding protein [Candidatus Methanoplasma sp.]
MEPENMNSETGNDQKTNMKLELSGIRQGYGSKIIVEDINMSVESGEVVTILGPNGSGKSTLIKTMCNIMEPKAGTITIDDVNISDIDKKEFAKIVGYVPQHTIYFGQSSVYDSVLLGRKPYTDWSYSREDINIAAEAMIRMNIDDLYDRPVSELSGGQVQRVSLARALAQNPRFYIFDEPTSALDLRNQLDTLKVMRRIIKENGASMVMAMHDLNLALRYSDKVLALKDGQVYGFGAAEAIITEEMIKDVYGVDSQIMDSPKGKFIYAFDDDAAKVL